MRIPMGTVSLYRPDETGDEQTVNATVESFKDDRVVVAVDDDAAFEVGCECQIRYSDDEQGGRFIGVWCVVESVRDGCLTVRAQSDPESVNQRLSFRVSIARSDIMARVGSFHPCRVLDISMTGIRVRVPGKLDVGDTVPVRFSIGGTRVEGRFCVRRIYDTKKGPQIGMSADAEDSRLIQALSQVVSELEREQLRRRSRIDGSEPEGVGVQDGGDGVVDADGEEARGGAEASVEGPWVRVPVSVLANLALPGTLVDHDGQVLARRGQVLSIEEFRELGCFDLYATDDWSAGSSSGGPEDRRVSARSCCKGSIRVIALRDDHVLTMPASLMDISRGGVGLRTPTILCPNMHLVLDCSSEDRNCWTIGRVVHVEVRKYETTCKVGVEFVLDGVQHCPVPNSVPEIQAWISGKRGSGGRRAAG